MSYHYIEDLKGIKDLKEIGGTASHFSTYFSGVRIRATDDGDGVFYQYIGGENLDPIEIAPIEYLGPTEEILDILNTTEEEFESYYGGATPGFYIGETLYLISEFIRDDY